MSQKKSTKIKMRLLDEAGIYIERTITSKEEFRDLSRWLMHQDWRETVYRTEIIGSHADSVSLQKIKRAKDKLARAFKRARRATHA